MADALFTDPQIKGLLPAVGRRQVKDRFVLEGDNFLVDAEGPHSDFGTNLMFHEPMYFPEGAQTFEVVDEIFIVNSEGFFVYDKTANTLIPRFIFSAAPTGDFPWSIAYVGGTHYFARQGLGNYIISYNASTLIWTSVSTNVPLNPAAVCEAGGRLVILGENEYAWSAFDNGTDLFPSTTTGAGTQSLALIENGNPLGVLPVADGCIVYTDEGLIRVTSINSINPFRHVELVRKIKPISPYALVLMDDTNVFLAEGGFYTTTGKKPVKWQPLFSEFIHRKVLKGRDFSKTTHVKIWYNYHRQWLGISLVDTETSVDDYLYDYAYVLYTPRDEWGKFSRQHYSIGEYWLDNVEFESENAGYIDADGYVHKFTDQVGVEQSLISLGYTQNHVSYEIPAVTIDNKIIFATHAQTFPVIQFINLPTSDIYVFELIAAYRSPWPLTAAASAAAVLTLGEDYNTPTETLEDWLVGSNNEDWNLGDDGLFSTTAAGAAGMAIFEAVIATPVYDPLNSAITVGLLRLTDQLVPDRFSTIYDLLIGTKTADNYSLTITGSLDGNTQFDTQNEVPALVKTQDEMDFYSCANDGIYHWIEMTAQSDGQLFHLKLLEASGTLTGRI